MIPEINYWAVLLGTIATMVIGSLWYLPATLGPRWERLARVDPNRSGASATIGLVLAVVMGFVTAWALAGAIAIAWHFYGGGYLWTAIATAVALWAGFVAARFITHDAMEGRPTSLTVINLGYELVMVLVVAVIIGVWPPAGTV